MTIEVSNCHECPFCNNGEYGRDQCNLSDRVDSENPIYVSDWAGEELPNDIVHYRCPLKRLNKVNIKIKIK
jgi:hypothetical protein